ncbi:hypothetical protein OIY81_2352 [Cryptosporidium canis]|nr:hypothetical protein OIY81_2352 [Cryptosporidium canis]
MSPVDRLIGVGTFGTVRAFRDSASGRLTVHKTANSIDKNGDLEKEDGFLRRLGGRYVVERYDSFLGEDGLFTIVLEYSPADLRMLMVQGGVGCFSLKRRLLFGILKGIEYIHSHQVAHNDLRPENILVNEDYSVKICDFGMATQVDREYIEFNKRASARIRKDSNLRSKGESEGAQPYKSPERLLGTNCTSDLFAGDMWSFGCIATEILTGETLFNGKSEIDQLLSILRIVGVPEGKGLNYLSSLSSVSEVSKQGG